MTTKRSTQDRAAMAAALPKIDECHKNIGDAQGRMFKSIVELRNRWKGHASDAFYEQYKLFNKEFDGVNAGLEDIHGKLVKSLQTYTENEETQKAVATNDIDAAINE